MHGEHPGDQRAQKIKRGSGALGGIGESDVVGPVGDEVVAEEFADFVVLDKKDAGHALDVSGRQTDEVAFEPGKEHAIEAFAIEILTKFGAGQPEGFIEVGVGISEARGVVEFVVSEKGFGFFFGPKMNKSELGAVRFDLFRDHFAAEGASEVAKKDEEEGPIDGKLSERLTRLRAVAAQ